MGVISHVISFAWWSPIVPFSLPAMNGVQQALNDIAGNNGLHSPTQLIKWVGSRLLTPTQCSSPKTTGWHPYYIPPTTSEWWVEQGALEKMLWGACLPLRQQQNCILDKTLDINAGLQRMVTRALRRIRHYAVISFGHFPCLLPALFHFIDVWFPLSIPISFCPWYLNAGGLCLPSQPSFPSSVQMPKHYFSFETWVLGQNLKFSPVENLSATWLDGFCDWSKSLDSVNDLHLTLPELSLLLDGTLFTLLVSPS